MEPPVALTTTWHIRGIRSTSFLRYVPGMAFQANTHWPVVGVIPFNVRGKVILMQFLSILFNHPHDPQSPASHN